MICQKCNCDQCLYNVINHPWTDEQDQQKVIGGNMCWNCEECYYYGRDNEELSRNRQFNCKRFKKANYYIEKEAKQRRISFRIINNGGN